MLKNPFYAGAYAYGKSENRTAIVDGRARKSYGHARPLEEWEVLLKDHHEGYIDWAEFERNQKQLAANAYRAATAPSPAAAGGRFWPGFCLWPLRTPADGELYVAPSARTASPSIAATART